MYIFNQVLTGFQKIEFINQKGETKILPLDEVGRHYERLYKRMLHCINQLHEIGYDKDGCIKVSIRNS